MKKYIYLVYVNDGYDGPFVDEDETKAFNSLDDAKAYRDYLKPENEFEDVLITKIEFS